MKNPIRLLATLIVTVFIMASCAKENSLLFTENAVPNQRFEKSGNDISLNARNVNGLRNLAIYADCEGFATIGTPANFKPTAGNFDELYNGEGMTAISESKPGDQDYNGGRWHVNLLKEGVDPAKYEGACAVEDLDLDDFESSSIYFECPLRPIR
jgi:hypothetical protein